MASFRFVAVAKLHTAKLHKQATMLVSKQAWLALANGLSVLTAPTPVGNEGGVSARREESVRECVREQGPLLLFTRWLQEQLEASWNTTSVD